ncbi:MAG: class II poly(R)-hydroxyalkanoic acid synthase [Actinobacteria bacterium]|nr:class II poly(R)-hydroxyalkanoic acid synthase [Actinomycetota bacterium]
MSSTRGSGSVTPGEELRSDPETVPTHVPAPPAQDPAPEGPASEEPSAILPPSATASPSEPDDEQDEEHPEFAQEAALLAGGAGAVVGPSPFVGFGPKDALDGLLTLGKKTLTNPRAVISAAPRTAASLFRIGTGRSAIAPDRSDKRFRDMAWEDTRLLKAVMQLYLFAGGEIDNFVESLGLPEKDVERVEFVVHLIREGLAPTNNLVLNPAALRKAKETRGESLARGLGNLIHDMRTNHGMPSQVNRKPYKVGENLAVTPGSVIYRDDIMEVIHYQPQTAQVGARPLLVIPPQVNKYYALDLAPGRSMYEYLIKHGIQLYGVSWRNPTAKERDWNFDTYAEAALRAIDVTRSVSRSPDVNIMGGCAGGMMVSILTALLASRGEKKINSTTMLVTLLDSRVDAEILLFASPQTVKVAKMQSSQKGYLDGWRMAQVFAWLRPNELVWNYWVNNYLMGNDPPSFDILAWNADTTRLPAALHHQLLDIVTENQLAKPGAVNILDTPIDIGRIGTDTYVVAGLTDHITPWSGCYHTTHMVAGDCRFVLCSSGHVQTLVATPKHKGMYYFTNPENPASHEDWLKGAQRQDGSWWVDWVEWLTPRSGPSKRAPRTLGSRKYPVIEPAPGSYIHT